MTASPYASKPWLAQYDPWVPATTTLPQRSLYHLISLAASQYRHRTATAFQGAELTFAEIKEQADRLACAFHQMGIAKGDRVGIMLPNSPQYMIAFFALMRLGAICANFNPAYTAREVQHQANDAGIRAMITLDTNAEMILGIQPNTKIETVIITSLAEYSDQKASAPLISGTVSYTGLLRGVTEVKLPRVEIDAANDVAVLQYTGGTTGVSKGAMLTHQNLYANVIQVVPWGGYFTRKGEERMIVVIPYFHIYALSICILLSCWNGTMQILVPKFDINLVLDYFRKYKPSFFPGVPTLYIALLNHPDAKTCGLDEVKTFNSGSAPLPLEVIEQFELMSGATIAEGYGLTEASPTTHSTPMLAKRKPGSVGLPVPSTEVKIVDIETGLIEVPLGEEGELCIRGPQVMKGYWNRPEETAYALRDGWLYTGDVSRMDEDGFFYIVQRKKDMIIVSGLKVFPNEVEDVLFTHPAVMEAAVIGVPHAYRGEEVKAYVVLKSGVSATAEELLAFSKERLAKFKLPTAIEFVPSLPKSSVGKVLRRELRDQASTKS